MSDDFEQQMRAREASMKPRAVQLPSVVAQKPSVVVQKPGTSSVAVVSDNIALLKSGAARWRDRLPETTINLDLDDARNPNYGIKGLFVKGKVTNLIAASGGGKTTTAIGAAHSMATAENDGSTRFVGRRVKRSPVLYVATELGGDAALMMAALEAATGRKCGDYFRVIDPTAQGFNLGVSSAFDFLGIVAAHAQDMLTRTGVGIVHVMMDTLSQALAGAVEEGSNTAMQGVVSTLGLIFKIIPASVTIIAHGVKPKPGEPTTTIRGGYAATAGDAIRLSTVREEREGQPPLFKLMALRIKGTSFTGPLGAFEFRSHSFGLDADGDEIAYPYAHPVPLPDARPEEHRKRLSDDAKRVLELLTRLYTDNAVAVPPAADIESTPISKAIGGKAARRSDLREKCRAAGMFGGGESDSMTAAGRKAFERALTELSVAGKAQSTKDWVWLIVKPGPPGRGGGSSPELPAARHEDSVPPHDKETGEVTDDESLSQDAEPPGYHDEAPDPEPPDWGAEPPWHLEEAFADPLAGPSLPARRPEHSANRAAAQHKISELNGDKLDAEPSAGLAERQSNDVRDLRDMRDSHVTCHACHVRDCVTCVTSPTGNVTLSRGSHAGDPGGLAKKEEASTTRRVGPPSPARASTIAASQQPDARAAVQHAETEVARPAGRKILTAQDEVDFWSDPSKYSLDGSSESEVIAQEDGGPSTSSPAGVPDDGPDSPPGRPDEEAAAQSTPAGHPDWTDGPTEDEVVSAAEMIGKCSPAEVVRLVYLARSLDYVPGKSPDDALVDSVITLSAAGLLDDLTPDGGPASLPPDADDDIDPATEDLLPRDDDDGSYADDADDTATIH